MKLSTSILSVKDNLSEVIDELNATHTDYIHLDIMDGIFVPNKTWDIDVLKESLKDSRKSLDIHLMVKDIKKYVDMYSNLHPKYITFHLEACEDIMETIGYIKDLGIKVGIAISPETKVESVLPYLPRLDLVLVMSVNPGMGGQQFLLPSIKKIDELYNYRMNSDLKYLINVDGGINDNTIKLVRKADMVVSGSFITNGDMNHNINTLINS